MTGTVAAKETTTDDEYATKTYRYLRITMIGVVVLLGVAVAIERFESGCWQTSISGY